MARLAPEESRTQLFGLYSLAGRATAPLGPALVGWLVLETGAQRSGAAVICVLMLIGLILMLPVREPRSSSLS
jgi:UMF1 family MFS transporter